MMTRAREPAVMTPEERLAEIASILAIGFRRFRQKRLDDTTASMALCVSPVNAPATET